MVGGGLLCLLVDRERLSIGIKMAWCWNLWSSREFGREVVHMGLYEYVFIFTVLILIDAFSHC